MQKKFILVVAALAGMGPLAFVSAPARAETPASACDAYVQSNGTMVDADDSQSLLGCLPPLSFHAGHKAKHRKLSHLHAAAATKLALRRPQPEPIGVSSPVVMRPEGLRVSSADICSGARANLLCPGYILLGIDY